MKTEMVDLHQKRILAILTALIVSIWAALPVSAANAKEHSGGDAATRSREEEDASSDGDGEETPLSDTETAEERILNGAELSPADPQSDALDEYVDELLEEITTQGMDTEDAVKACYDYLVENVKYGSHTRYLGTQLGETGATCRQIYSAYGEVEGFGSVALAAGVGMCNAYASAFIVMTRAIGLDSHLVEGSTGSARGGYAYHKWAEIDIDGITYVFDPQLEQNLIRSGLPAYSVYCKTYDQIPGRYIRKARND